MTSVDQVLRGGTCVTPNGVEVADVAILDGRIAAIGDLGRLAAAETIDASGLHVLPGVIDTHVHFGEPGREHREDLGTGTAAAVLGGVTAVLEMPDTDPATTTPARLADKCRRAKNRIWADAAFYVGASPETLDALGDLEASPGSAGVAVFKENDDNALRIDSDAALARVLASGRRRATVLCGPAQIPNLVRLARGVKRRIHLPAVAAPEALAALQPVRDLITIGATPDALTVGATDDLWTAVRDGTVDCLASGHWPASAEEASGDRSRSPGVQTLLPIMLDHVAAGRLSLERLVDLIAAGPTRVFGLAGKGRIARGYDADLTLVDLKARRTIADRWIVSRCGWTPFDGKTVTGWPVATFVRGRPVMVDGALVGDPSGTVLRFLEAL